jgi:hypothetical protein
VASSIAVTMFGGSLNYDDLFEERLKPPALDPPPSRDRASQIRAAFRRLRAEWRLLRLWLSSPKRIKLHLAEFVHQDWSLMKAI